MRAFGHCQFGTVSDRNSQANTQEISKAASRFTIGNGRGIYWQEDQSLDLDLLTNWGKQHESLGGSLFIDWDSLYSSFRSGGQKSQQDALAAYHGDKPGKEAV